jgi:hypothetical protein
VVDVHETPAVPPFDPKGDVRTGYLVAGGLLIFLGWGVAVVLNLLLHYWAGAGGLSLRFARISSSLGPYAWAAVGFGVVTGALGLVLLLVGRTAPKGPLVLPGYDY